MAFICWISDGPFVCEVGYTAYMLDRVHLPMTNYRVPTYCLGHSDCRCPHMHTFLMPRMLHCNLLSIDADFTVLFTTPVEVVYCDFRSTWMTLSPCELVTCLLTSINSAYNS